MHPFTQMWLLLHLPHALLIGVWALAGRRSTLAGALVAGILLGEQVWTVGNGGLPRDGGVWPDLLVPGILAAVLFHGDRQRFALPSVLYAAVFVGLQQPLPAVVLLGTGWAKRASVRAQIGLGTIASAMGLRLFFDLEVASLVGKLGLSIDGTTIAARWLIGALHLLGWTVLLVGTRASPNSDAARLPPAGRGPRPAADARPGPSPAPPPAPSPPSPPHPPPGT